MPAKRKKSAKPKKSRISQHPPKINELLYKTLIENTNIGISLMDANRRIITSNVGHGKIFRKPARELIGKFCYKEFEKRNAICPHCPGTKSMATGRPAEADVEGVRDNGQRFAAHIETFPVFEPDGSISGFIEIAEDVSEYKQTEKSLKESEQRFEAIFDNAADGIALADAESKKFYMSNKVFCQMTGYRPEEIKKLAISDIHPRKHFPYVLNQFEKQAQKEITLATDIPVKRKDGSVFYTDVNAFPVILGGRAYLMGIFRDITERRQAEENLKESEQRFRAIFDNAADGILLTDIKSKRFYLGNKTICKMLGYTLEEIKNMKVPDIHPKEYSSFVIKDFEKQAGKEAALSENIPVKRKDGSVFYVDIHTFQITLGGKTYLGGAFRDTTERKRAEEELRQAEAKYRVLVEHIPAVTYTAALDKTSTTTYVSPQIERFLGFSQKHYNIDHDLWLKQLHPEDRQRVLKSLRKTHVDGQPFNCEYRMFNKDGRVVWFRDEAVILRDASGKPLILQGVMFDITAQKQAEEELNTYRDKMARAERLASLGTLSATVAHELTQPLTVIRLSIENLLEDLNAASCPKSASDTLEEALSGVSNAVSVVDRFRNYARQSSEKNLQKTNLNEVANRIIKLLAKTAQRANMTLTLKNMDKLPPVQSNEKELEQLFFALTENAIQAADGKKNQRLTIEGAVKDNNIELRFRDNCRGITPENLKKLFDPFFTTRSDEGRTGLGLPIVLRIVSGYGGKIKVRSRPGKGTTFYVTLPTHP